MQPAPAKMSDSNALERLGGATLEIVHDLKNQLNGLKLYATFLRKRLARQDQPDDERETLAKLITGLDRAAKELTSLVRFARPVELRKKSGVEIQRIVSKVVTDAAERETGGLPKVVIAADFGTDQLIGEFDPIALTEAISAVTDDVRATVSAKEPQPLSIVVRRDSAAGQATIEWRGARFSPRSGALTASGCGTIHTEVARKIFEAHDGAITCEHNIVRAVLPLTDHKATNE